MVAEDDLAAWARGPGLWRRSIRRLWGRPRLASAAELQRFISERAAFVAQKSAIDYCRGKTGLFSHALFEEKAFIDALTVCRWETFATVVGDIIVLVEGSLRDAAGAVAPRLAQRLAGLYPAILAHYPLPAHRPHGWDDAARDFRQQFEQVLLAPPRPAAEIALRSARRLFETLPIHASVRTWDEEVVHGAVCFRMVAVRQDFENRIDKAALIEDLVGDDSR